MWFLTYLFFIFPWVISTQSHSLNRRYAIKDRHPIPPGWQVRGRAPADHVLNLKIGLKQSRFHLLDEALYQVSDPTHERYGSHLKSTEVHDLIKPSEEADKAVHDWLDSCGIDSTTLSYSPARDWITVALPISSVERLLDAEYNEYINEQGETLHRTPNWSLPLHLHDHIVTIQPTNSFLRKRAAKIPMWKKHHHMGGYMKPPLDIVNTSSCNASMVTLPCIRTLYGTIDYEVKAADKNKMALNNFLGEINNRSDARIYLELYRPEAVSGAEEFSQVSIAGGTLQQTPDDQDELAEGTGIEGDLDAETMLGIAWPIPLVTYSTSGLNPVYIPDAFTPTNTDEPYLVWLEYILGLPDEDLPTVVSTSYDDDEQTIPYSYASQVCNMFAQLGARGVSVVFGSGDDGVGEDPYCIKNDGTNTPAFIPEFPGSCPYVTTVGATANFTPEVAAYKILDNGFLFASGGGFSNYFPQPRYQRRTVSRYLNEYVKDEYSGLYNRSGRAYPDLAAQGQNTAIVWNGSVLLVSGSSAATPTMAAIIALVNDALISAGRSPLGFLNPWLYSRGHVAFTDILSGSSIGCNTTGFPATPGWDAVTGFGTPNFPRILEVLGLPFK